MIFDYWFENAQTEQTEDNLELNDSPVFTYILPWKNKKEPRRNNNVRRKPNFI